MIYAAGAAAGLYVALRKESVDRNTAAAKIIRRIAASLSARRAWIEIHFLRHIFFALSVALRKESVDRNNGFGIVQR